MTAPRAPFPDRTGPLPGGSASTAEPVVYGLLGPRLHLHALVRFGVAAFLLVGGWTGRHLFGIANLDTTALTGAAAAIAAYGVVVWAVVRRSRTSEVAVLRHHLLLRIMYATVLLDFLALATVAWLLGGLRSPMVVFFLVHVMLTAVLLTPREAVLAALLAFGLMGGLAWVELTGLAPPPRPEGVVGPGPMDIRFALVALVVYGATLAAVTWLLIGLTRAIRGGESRLQAAYAALERVAGLRRDFLDIAIHNIKAPVGAATMFLQNLRSGLAGPLNEKQEEWVDRGLQRLGGLNDFLGDLRLLATLETGTLDERMEALDIVPMALGLAEEWGGEAEERGIRFVYDGPSSAPAVRGNDRLVREAVANYLSNALKFTPRGGEVVLAVEPLPDTVRIAVRDTGPGIAPERQERLFREFRRRRGADAPDDAPRGSGIGLSIVRRIADVHGASVGCRSQVGQGSEFFFELPVAKD
ncbi:MAG: HAMP domain-containing sensor histidine kinase [Gemmatimonadota bacterium]|nr:HAMP domain-containing sensor histidine kinase [Gemmatimonadota bacterium]